MNSMRRPIAFLAVLATACGASSAPTTTSHSDLRELSEAEIMADLESLGASIRTSYGPIDFKREHVGFDLDSEMELARATVHAGRTEGERLFALYQLTGHLKDLHVGLTAGLASDGAYTRTLPFTLAPVEDGKYVVVATLPAARGAVAPGDVVTAFDGTAVADLEKILATFADYAVLTSSRERWATYLTSRRSWMPATLLPHGDTAKLTIDRADGTEVTVEVPWGRSANLSEQVAKLMQPATTARATTPTAPRALPVSPQALEMQAEDARIPTASDADAPFPNAPFFYNATTSSKFGFTAVTPSVVPPTASGLGAVKYVYNGKTLLLVRIPTFLPPDIDANLDWLATLLADAEQGPLDAVILDETHNGGGTSLYAQGIASLFVTTPIPADTMSYRADRAWLESFGIDVQFLADTPTAKKFFGDSLLDLEKAIDTGATLSSLWRDASITYGTDIPVGDEAYGPTITAHPKVTWKGPTLVLTNSRSVSAADMFPLIMQNGGVAKTFGARTAGGGGMVEVVTTLTNTGLAFSCTRGFFGAYTKDGSSFRYIENNGVEPDFPHPLTTADVRGAYVDYVKHFSDVASTLRR